MSLFRVYSVLRDVGYSILLARFSSDIAIVLHNVSYYGHKCTILVLFRIGFLKGCSSELPRLVTGPIQAAPKSVTTHHPCALATSAVTVRGQQCECGVGVAHSGQGRRIATLWPLPRS